MKKTIMKNKVKKPYKRVIMLVMFLAVLAMPTLALDVIDCQFLNNSNTIYNVINNISATSFVANDYCLYAEGLENITINCNDNFLYTDSDTYPNKAAMWIRNSENVTIENCKTGLGESLPSNEWTFGNIILTNVTYFKLYNSDFFFDYTLGLYIDNNIDNVGNISLNPTNDKNYFEIYNNRFYTSSGLDIYFDENINASYPYDLMPYNYSLNMYNNRLTGIFGQSSESLENITLNTTLQNGTRIFGNGNLIGGNWWVGYSESCVDVNNIGICDSPFDIFGDSSAYDYLPLSDNYAVIVPPFNNQTCANGTIQNVLIALLILAFFVGFIYEVMPKSAKEIFNKTVPYIILLVVLIIALGVMDCVI